MNPQHQLLDKIRQIEEEGKTGFLPLSHEDQTVQIHFDKGLISAVSSNFTEHRLGQYLVKEGIVGETYLHNLLGMSLDKKKRIGEVILELGIADAWAVRQAITQQVIQLVGKCVENGFEVGSFVASSSTLSLPAQISLDSILSELEQGVSKLPADGWQETIVLKSHETLYSYSWSPQEIFLLTRLRYPRTFDSLISETGLEDAEIRRMVEKFSKLGLIDLGFQAAVETAALIRKERFPFESFVPEIRDSGHAETLEVLNNESSFISEQFRSLKVRIDELNKERPVKVICVCSAHTQDGKSLVSSNLALSFSKDSARRVILVDCDLRNSSIHKFLGIPSEPGLIGYLNETRLEPYCFMRRINHLFVMTAGGTSKNPIDLLSDSRMSRLMAYLREEFDTVILDAPPIVPISDARLLSGLADCALLVIRSGKTPYRSFEKAVKSLDRKQILGIVFNDVKPMRFHTYYDHIYYNAGSSSAYPYAPGTKKDRK